MVDIESPVTNHRRTNSDVTDGGKLLANSNLAYIDTMDEDDLDMSPLKRLQRLKQYGTLRLVPKSRKQLKLPADMKSDSSLLDKESKNLRNSVSKSDDSLSISTDDRTEIKSCVRLTRTLDRMNSNHGNHKNHGNHVHFKDEVDLHNGNTCGPLFTSSPTENTMDSNMSGPLFTTSPIDGPMDSNGNTTDTVPLPPPVDYNESKLLRIMVTKDLFWIDSN